MFHKEHSSSSILGGSGGSNNSKKVKDVPLRKSDRKDLKQRIERQLQLQDDSTSSSSLSLWNDLFVNGTLSRRNVSNSNQTSDVVLYYRSGKDDNDDDDCTTPSRDGSTWPYVKAQCIWVELLDDHHATAGVVVGVPTVTLLSVLSPSVYAHCTVTVPAPVSTYLCKNGAHLMKAGMRSVPFDMNATNSNHRVVVAVVIPGNPQAFATGILQSDVRTVHDVGIGTKGVGVHIVTCYGDDFWNQQQQQQQQPSRSMLLRGNHHHHHHRDDIHARINRHGGGGNYNAGHFGNVGFRNGEQVVPIPTNHEPTDNDKHDMVAPNVEDPPNETGLEKPVNDESLESCNRRTDESGPSDPDGVKNSTPADPTDDEDSVKASPVVVSDSMTPDEVLHVAVCRALSKLSKKDLPMLVNIFYANHVLPNRPEGTTVQLKQTKWKKINVYLAEMVEKGIVTIGPDAKSNDPWGVLRDYNQRHEDLKDLVQLEKSLPKRADGPAKLVLVDLYCLPRHFGKLLRLDADVVKASNASSTERQNTGMLTLKELRAILDDYVAREQLTDPVHPNVVRLDGPLSDALYKKQSAPGTLSRHELAEIWKAKMEPAYALVELPGNRIIKLGRGTPPAVQIEVSMRQSKKFVTRVRGMEDFGIDASSFAAEVTRRFACASSMEENPEGRAAMRKGHVELLFQGNLVDELEALLVGDASLTSHGGAKGSPYRLPKNAIVAVLRKGVPPRRKKQEPSKKKK